MKFYFITMLFVLVSIEISAQPYEKTFAGFSSFTFREYGISCKLPEGFTDLNRYMAPWWINKSRNRHMAMFYGPIIRSADKGCVLMYPFMPLYVSADDEALGKILTKVDREFQNGTMTVEPKAGSNEQFPRTQILAELRVALGIPIESSDTLIVFEDYVTGVRGKVAREMFNADLVYFYDLPLKEAYDTDYVHCTGMVITKRGRATMYFKWFFTEEGKQKQLAYLKLLAGNVWHDTEWKVALGNRFIKEENR